MPKRARDLTGFRSGLLTAQWPVGRDRFAHVLWLCCCDCGELTIVANCDLSRQHVRSCGCTRRAPLRPQTHGESKPHPTTEYNIWRNMIQRCTNPKRKDYPRYGGRGVQVCVRWRNSYEAFLKDVGRRPHLELTLDRIDNDGDYEPGNVRWATHTEQIANRSTAKAA